MQSHQRAESGISTLVIFVAMILVAAIAALVLVQTTGALQSQATATGREAKSQVATQLQIMQVTGEVNSDSNASLRMIRVTAKLAPGSPPVLLSQLAFSVRDGNGDFFATADYNLAASNSEADVNSATGISTLAVGSAGSVFAVKYLTTAPTGRSSIGPNDLVEVWFAANNLVSTNESVEIAFETAQGTGSRLSFRTPVSFSKKFESLYP